MTKQLFRFRRYALAALLILVAAIGTRAQAPEFSYWERTPLPQQGLATYYNPGVMEEVLGNRLDAQDIDPCPECVGTVALLRAGDIGRKVWLQPPGGDPIGPFLVVDCARRQDVQPLLDRNWVVDVSWEVGQYWGMNRPLDGVIVFEDPADVVHGKPVNRIPTPFVVAPADVVISAPTSTPTGPPVPEAPPTAWPTRMPVPLAGVTVAARAPTETPVPPTPTAIWPPPKTPIITTPTVVATEGQTLPALTPAEPSGAAAETPSATPTEVALGRAGGGLLEEAGAASTSATPSATPPPAGVQPAPTNQASPLPPTARPTLGRTPRPNLTPILAPGSTPTPTATPTPDPWLLDRILRGLIDLVR